MIGKIILAGAVIVAVRTLVGVGEKAKAAASPPPAPVPVTDISVEDAWNEARQSVREASVPTPRPATPIDSERNATEPA
ncbi:hypothetical protein [Sphingobium phenoxybenzoativorans]|uniref:hypothetical protein n=1 Tax=Sphingobium phenoxybenzoativorans TaxID=1592790 RepID=UPI000872AA1A|nr:hypothetical protein [Sphingobium phenoxybenzoativorans]